MFFFIGGMQPRTVRLEKQERACPYCSHFEVYVKRTDQYLSAFFIPVIRLQKGTPYVVCESCGALLEGERDAGEGKENRCRSCGRPLDPSFLYCPYCGQTK